LSAEASALGHRGRDLVRGPYRLSLAAAAEGIPTLGTVYGHSASGRSGRPLTGPSRCCGRVRYQAGRDPYLSVKGADTVVGDFRAATRARKSTAVKGFRRRHPRPADHCLTPGRLLAGPRRSQSRPDHRLRRDPDPTRLRRPRLRRPPGRLGPDHAQPHPGDHHQTRRPA
jgi:hypothetical protein